MRTYRKEFAVEPRLDEVTGVVIAEASTWEYIQQSTSFPEESEELNTLSLIRIDSECRDIESYR